MACISLFFLVCLLSLFGFSLLFFSVSALFPFTLSPPVALSLLFSIYITVYNRKWFFPFIAYTHLLISHRAGSLKQILVHKNNCYYVRLRGKKVTSCAAQKMRDLSLSLSLSILLARYLWHSTSNRIAISHICDEHKKMYLLTNNNVHWHIAFAANLHKLILNIISHSLERRRKSICLKWPTFIWFSIHYGGNTVYDEYLLVSRWPKCCVQTEGNYTNMTCIKHMENSLRIFMKICRMSHWKERSHPKQANTLNRLLIRKEILLFLLHFLNKSTVRLCFTH